MASDQDLSKKIYNSALGLLSRREHSLQELRQKILKKYSPIDLCLLDDALHRLKENGLQSNERFCECYIRSRLAKGFGLERIENELRERGIADGVRGVEQEFDINAVLASVWRKKFKVLPADFEEKTKHIRFLRYRGFSQGDIDRLFNKLER